MHIDRERIEKSWKELIKETLKIPETLQGTLNLDSMVNMKHTENEN